MENIKHVFKREFKSYFISPIAYIVISIFLLIIGWLFFSTFFLNGQASLMRFFTLLPITFAFIIPAVTMRLFSEEMNVGTYEILLTLPVTFRDIIVGKFLAAVAFVAIMLVPTIFYGISTALLGKLDWGPVIGGYIGALLLGAAFCAIGLLASSLTKNQVIAFIIGMVICFSLTLLVDYGLYLLLPEAWVKTFQYLSASFHFQNIAKGVLDSRDVLYFLSVMFIALYGANLIMQEKK
ncbi:MAG: ABC transporter permease subunit [Candidatus Aminicenantes bacterium]|nr:MAG: ABC transporter permease subunit [Candidatus Aminicenantes bacterium]